MSDAASMLYPSMPSASVAPAPTSSSGVQSGAAEPVAHARGATDGRHDAAQPTDATHATGEAEHADGGHDVLEVPQSWETARWNNEPPASSVSEYGNFVMGAEPDSKGVFVADAPTHGLALEAMKSAGLGATTARAMYDLARDAHLNPPNTDRATAEAQLRATWGRHYESNLTAVQGLVDQAAKAWPGVRDYLRTSGLGNDPRFLIAAARKATGK